MIFDETDKRLWRYAISRRATLGFLPGIWLALVKITVLGCRNEFLRRPEIIGVIRFVPSGQSNEGAVMEVVVPQTVEIVAPFAARANHLGFLRLILRNQNQQALPGCCARGSSDCANNVLLRLIVDILRRVESETVKVKFLNPVTPIGNEKLADRTRVRPVKVNRLAPVVFVLGGEIIIRENADVISIRAEVVVNNIENH